MEMELAGLGAFQFENLVKNRIPFLLLNFGVELKGLFPSFHESHLLQQSQLVEKENYQKTLRELGLSKDQALVLLCADGKVSTQVFAELSEQGFFNVYWIRDGFEALKKDLSAISG